ncbi:transcription factor bHLH123-like isoform X2 [Mangifera indica]|uniref:transcription factor bHLH123-like isoform X2 n=1 Tax=Mangifera indica TaxID=29780 RepID=UPI001CFA7E62|nr:transcription factor bHLH123-like isoform X2 [Mangifera indica]
MADEFNTTTNWWDSSRTRFDNSGSSSSSSGLNSLGSFGWPTEMVDIKARTSTDSSVSGSSLVFQDTQKLQQPPQDSTSAAAGGVADLHMVGLGLSSPSMEWNQTLLRGDKSENSFRSILQENLNSSANYQQETGLGSSQVHWRSEKLFSGVSGDSSVNEFKQINRGFSLDHQPQFSPHGGSSSDSTVTCQGLPSSFQIDSSALYGSPSTILQGILGAPENNDNNNNQPHQSSMNYQYGGASSYGNELVPSWSKVPQFLRTSPPKQPPQHSHLHFSNNAPYWNASAASMNDVRSSGFFPSLQTPYATQNYEEKPKHAISEAREPSTAVKKSNSGSEAASKRPRNETASAMPAFKVRKEKMGDRITALQQLVSPFGKTDTASVLSEAIEYIKFLHEQILSTPYMKSGAPSIQHQQNSEKSKDSEGPKQDLRSRGLCLVPVSSTFPVAHETTVDFWTPAFGGTFR